MHWCSLFLALALVSHATGITLVEFCPDPYLPEDRDEYFCLEGSGPLEGVMISDGEGSVRFPAGAVLAGRCVVARDAEAYRRSHGEYPDYEWDGTTREVPDMARTGRFQLANTRDEITLYRERTPVQRVEWPGMVSTRQGQVHYFQNGTWDPRILMLGQSQFPEATFQDADGLAFVSPDCSRDVFLSLARSARTEILVAVYEFTSPVLAGALVEAADRGVNVTVLLEGGPVGGIPKEEKWVISRLEEHGIPVYTMSGTSDVHAPYRYMHAKYMIVDRSSVLITSENFKESGFPERGKRGNRGFGVVVTHPGLAGYFFSVFSHDAGGKYTIRAKAGDGPEEMPSQDAYSSSFETCRFSGATVTPVISPDTSSLVRRLVRGAERSVDIEMAYITNESGSMLNPFLSDAIEAARRGVRVRVLLDSYYYNIEGESDNDEMVAVINRIAAAEGLPLEARCADTGPGKVEKIHNKGAIIDGRRVLVSSINWNANSPVNNREAALIVDHPGVGAYFTSVFESDWNRAGQERIPGHGPDTLKLVTAALVVAVLIVLFRFRKRGR
ncbi:MAG: phospholipase D-like domain-containing protein [Methanolinea sp.]|jgi:phosphatidylserine/phosphatidylglycerophosphate/cardiolipin synthase-like enzyme|nr:phospholipase D-like domain-containing protein [Methanolinea sp.]